jgi:O-antigen ligase
VVTENRTHLPLLNYIAIGWVALVDLPNRVGLGSTSLAGLATVGIAIGLVAIGPLRVFRRAREAAKPTPPVSQRMPQRMSHHWVPLPLTLFAVWSAIRLLPSPTVEGVQNVSVYLIFVLAITVTASSSTAPNTQQTLRLLSKAAALSTLVFLASIVIGVDLYGPRPFALVALVFLAILIPNTTRHGLARLAPYMVLFAVTVSLSRMAIAIAVGFMPLIVLRGHGRGRAARGIALLLAAVASLWFLVTSYAPLRDRFLTGDNAITVEGLQLNTSGRNTIWQITIDSANTSPIFGHGPGSSVELMISHFSNISQPHNDYLRIYHDLGLVGLALFIVGYGLLLRATLTRAHRTGHPEHWTAAIALAGIAAAASTDNVLVYPFVMLPVGVLVGMSMASPMPPRRTVTDSSRPEKDQSAARQHA